MEVTNERVAVLSNFEVYDLLKSIQDKHKKKRSNGRSQNVATITYETSEYLSNSPCSQQSISIVQNFMKGMEKYKLTRSEKLQLLNLKPETPVELQLIVEDIESRFTDEETTELLDLIPKLLETDHEKES